MSLSVCLSSVKWEQKGDMLSLVKVLIAELSEAAIVFPADTGNSSEVLSLQDPFLEPLTNQGYRITDGPVKRLFCSFRLYKFPV